MSRVVQCGYEIAMKATGQDTNPPDGLFSTSAVGQATKDSAISRSGSSSCKLDSTASNSGVWVSALTNFTTAANRIFYLQGYFYFDTLPASTVQIMQLYSGAVPCVSVRLTAAGKIQLFDNGAGVQIGSDSVATLTTGIWYRIAIRATNSASSLISSAEVRLDGVSVANGNLANPKLGPTIRIGWIDVPGADKVMHLDDVVANDSQGSVNNSWPDEEQVILLCPNSDEQIGSWLGGAGGTTSLAAAVSNIPPAGVASASKTNTSQIKCGDTTADNPTDEYRGVCRSYSMNGISALDTITAITTIASHGEDVATGSPSGSFGAQANPIETYGVISQFGGNAGAVGAWPTNWRWKTNPPIEYPVVTVSDPLVLAIRKTDAGAAIGVCDFMGAYVAFMPSAITVGPPQLERKASQRALTRRRM